MKKTEKVTPKKKVKPVNYRHFKVRFDNVIINKLGIKREQIKPDVDFMQEFGINSLDLIEVIVDLEKRFKVDLTDEEVDKIKTVKDAETIFIEKLFEKRASGYKKDPPPMEYGFYWNH